MSAIHQDHGQDRLARLLRLAESEAPEVRPAAFRRARMVVESEWIRALRARRRRRLAVAAGFGTALAAAAALVLWMTAPGLLYFRSGDEPQPFAELVRGSLTRDDGVATPGTALVRGADLRTSVGEGAAIRLADGRSLRLAPATSLRLEGPARVELAAGALYVDSPPAAAGRALVVSTPYGEARNLATQFELRVEEGALRLRVREGRVRLATPQQDVIAGAGMEVAWTPGKVETSAVPVRGEMWRPYVELAHFELEGATLGDFLAWVSRETALRVEWSEPALELRMRGVVLHGTLGGTPPELAPAAVLPTAGLGSRIDDDVLYITTGTSTENQGARHDP